MAVTNELHKVLVFVADPDAILLDYDKITVFKSTTGNSGDYSEILKAAPVPASLLGSKQELFDVDGKEFKFSVDGTEYTMTFGAVSTAVDVAADIVLKTSQIATNDGGKIRITSASTGLSSTVEIETSTEGGVALGMYLGDYDIGEGQWIDVVSGTRLYILDDPHSANGYWYKVRYVNSATSVVSDFLAPFQARPSGAIDPSEIIYGVGYVADTEGNPVAGKAIVVYNKFVPRAVSGRLVDGPEIRSYLTDSLGLVAIPLVRGISIAIGVESTKLRRDIEVPTTGDSFDLFDQTLLDDRLGIAYYPIIDAERTVL